MGREEAGSVTSEGSELVLCGPGRRRRRKSVSGSVREDWAVETFSKVVREKCEQRPVTAPGRAMAQHLRLHRNQWPSATWLCESLNGPRDCPGLKSLLPCLQPGAENWGSRIVGIPPPHLLVQVPGRS